MNEEKPLVFLCPTCQEELQYKIEECWDEKVTFRGVCLKGHRTQIEARFMSELKTKLLPLFKQP